MASLLTATGLRSPASAPAGDEPRRPLAVGAAAAGLAAAVSVLVGCLAMGLVGWFASDAGSHGDTRDALRVGADAWLLALGARLDLPAATIGVVPLGLTALCGYVAFRLGRWAALTSTAEDVRTVLLGAVVLAGSHAAVAVVTAVLASLPTAQPHPGRALVGGFLVGLVGGGAGLVSGSGRRAAVTGRLPQWLRTALLGGGAALLLLFAASAVLVAVAVLLDLGEGATVLSRLHTDGAGGLLFTVVVAATAPNVALLGAAYLLGPGFAVGTGTVVSPSVVTLGPVPAYPLLAALPTAGPTPWWTALLMAVPVLAGAAAAGMALRRRPVHGYAAGAARGLGAGIVGALLSTAAIGLAGGSVGPGRMAEVGAPLLVTLLWGGAALGLGGLLGGLSITWWHRRSG
jgi:hypothetical protein